MVSPRIVVHAGVDTPADASVLAALERAARAGTDEMGGSGDAVRGVEAAVRVLEDAPMLNAGYGSVLNRDGDVETDASIVDGSAGRSASVAALTDMAHPISVATELLRRAPGPVLLAAEGAKAFARMVDQPPRDLRTSEQIRAWERVRDGETRYSPFTGRQHRPADTVGAIGVGPDGRLAVASSTGGIAMKMPGRVGDAAIVGAGIYANERVAVLCSGVGEAAIELSLALRTALHYEDRGDADDAAVWAIRQLDARVAIGGVILLDARGDSLAVAHNADVFPVLSMGTKGIATVRPVLYEP